MKSRNACRGQVRRGAKIHTKIFLTLSRKTCGKVCEAHLHKADKALDVAVKGARRGTCRAMNTALRRAAVHVRKARKAA